MSASYAAALARARSFFGRKLKPDRVKEMRFKDGACFFEVGPVEQINYIAHPRESNEKLKLGHAFKGKRPTLYISADGKTAVIHGGSWKFTGRGFVP